MFFLRILSLRIESAIATNATARVAAVTDDRVILEFDIVVDDLSTAYLALRRKRDFIRVASWATLIRFVWRSVKTMSINDPYRSLENPPTIETYVHITYLQHR